jgi:hypothetical protein
MQRKRNRLIAPTIPASHCFSISLAVRLLYCERTDYSPIEIKTMPPAGIAHS